MDRNPVRSAVKLRRARAVKSGMRRVDEGQSETLRSHSDIIRHLVSGQIQSPWSESINRIFIYTQVRVK